MRRPKINPSFSGNRYYRGAPPTAPQRPSRGQRRVVDGVARRHGRVVARLTVIVSLLVGFWYFGTLSGVTISSNQASQTDNLERSIKEHLTGFRLIKLLVNPGDLRTKLRTKHPELADLRIYTTLGSRKLQVAAVFRQPVALLVDGNSAVLGAVDQAGIVYPQGVDTVNLPKIEESTALSPQADQPFIAHRVLDFIRQAESALARVPEGLFGEHRWRLVSLGREVHLVSPLPYVVKLSIDRSAQDQINELMELTRYFSAHRSSIPATYVDLRVDDTAYYR